MLPTQGPYGRWSLISHWPQRGIHQASRTYYPPKEEIDCIFSICDEGPQEVPSYLDYLHQYSYTGQIAGRYLPRDIQLRRTDDDSRTIHRIHLFIDLDFQKGELVAMQVVMLAGKRRRHSTPFSQVPEYFDANLRTYFYVIDDPRWTGCLRVAGLIPPVRKHNITILVSSRISLRMLSRAALFCDRGVY